MHICGLLIVSQTKQNVFFPCRSKNAANEHVFDTNLLDNPVYCSSDRVIPAPDVLPPNAADNHPNPSANTDINYANHHIFQVPQETRDNIELLQGNDRCQPNVGHSKDAALFDDEEYNSLNLRDLSSTPHSQITPRQPPVGGNESQMVGSEGSETGGQHEYGVLQHDAHKSQTFHDDNVYNTMEEDASTPNRSPQDEFSEDVLQSSVPNSITGQKDMQKDANHSDQGEPEPEYYSYPEAAKTGGQGTGVDPDTSGAALYSNLMLQSGGIENNYLNQLDEEAMVNEQGDNQRTANGYNHEPIYSEEVYGDL